MHSNSSFWGETVFLVHFIEFSTRSCCLYYFNVTESGKNMGGEKNGSKNQIEKIRCKKGSVL